VVIATFFRLRALSIYQGSRSGCAGRFWQVASSATSVLPNLHSGPDGQSKSLRLLLVAGARHSLSSCGTNSGP
jgi:hypothetical protein